VLCIRFFIRFFCVLFFCFAVEKEGAITALESELQGLKSLLLESKEEINQYREKENERFLKDTSDSAEQSSATVQLDVTRAELQAAQEQLVALQKKYDAYTAQADSDLLALKESSEEELLFLGNVLSESKEKSKVMRSQLDGLGAAVESATTALRLSESTLEDRDKALSEAQAAQQLYEERIVASEMQSATLKAENIKLQLLLEQSVHELEEVRGQLFNMDMSRDEFTANKAQIDSEIEAVNREISIVSETHAATLQIKSLHSEVNVKSALNDRLKEQVAALTAELLEEKRRAADTKVWWSVV
jgi:chromosome segregation ATPase